MEILYKTNDDGADSAISTTASVELPPIGKALHLLLHIVDSVFDKAAADDTTQTPAARALQALNAYLDQGSFADVVDPLQLLKPKSSPPYLRLSRYLLLKSRHSTSFGLFIRHGLLNASDKRHQLAGVLLLEHVADHPTSANFISDLTRVALQYREEPMTLLPCTACNVAIQSSRHATGDYLWMRELIPLMQKWYPFDSIATAAWESIDRMVQCIHGPSKLWHELSTLLHSKHLMTKKSLSIKKQLAYLEPEEPEEATGAHLVSVALLQKSQWLGEELPSDLTTAIQKHVSSMVDCTWAQPLVVTMLLMTPGLCAVYQIPMDLMIPLARLACINQEHAKAFLPYAMSHTSEAIHALSDIVGQDSDEQAARILNDMMDNAVNSQTVDLEEFSMPLVEDMLSWVCSNDLACKVLIRYMDIADLRHMLIRLVSMAYGAEPRKNQVCKALIGKTMLAQPWSNGDGIILFIDMIRDLNNTHCLPHPTTPTLTSPSDLFQQQSPSGSKLDDQEVDRYSWELLSVLQLWVMKATPEGVKHGLRELVYRSYAAPQDTIYIHAWQNIASQLIVNHPDVIWTIMEHCTQIMKDQARLTDDLVNASTEESDRAVYTIVMKRLSPMLILRALQANAYTIVRLPPAIESEKLVSSALGVDRHVIKWETKDTDLATSRVSVALFHELIFRAQDPSEYGDIQQLARDLLTLIFCKSKS